MSVEPILIALQAAFIVLLYIFIWRVVRTAERGLPAAPQESFVLAPAQVAQARAEAGVAPGRLVVVRSKTVPVGKAFDPGPVPMTFGRAEDNVVALPGDDYASGHHARVESGLDGTWVIDLGSTNGTFLNGARLKRAQLAKTGDVIKIGSTELQVQA